MLDHRLQTPPDVIELPERQESLNLLPLLGRDVVPDRLGQKPGAFRGAVIDEGIIKVECERLGRPVVLTASNTLAVSGAFL